MLPCAHLVTHNIGLVSSFPSSHVGTARLKKEAFFSLYSKVHFFSFFSNSISTFSEIANVLSVVSLCTYTTAQYCVCMCKIRRRKSIKKDLYRESTYLLDFPGDAVDKNLPANAEDTVSEKLSVLKSRGILLPTKVYIIKAMVFPVVM